MPSYRPDELAKITYDKDTETYTIPLVEITSGKRIKVNVNKDEMDKFVELQMLKLTPEDIKH